LNDRSPKNDWKSIFVVEWSHTFFCGGGSNMQRRQSTGQRRHAALTIAVLLYVAIESDFAAAAPAATQQETVVFVRHGEKFEKGLGQIDCQGFNRALALTAVLTKQFGTPDYIFAPNPGQQIRDSGQNYNYIRPLATIEPTAIRLGMPIDTRFGYKNIALLQRELVRPRYRNALVFVAWEHDMLVNVVRHLVSQAGSDPSIIPDWSHDDFDSIYVLRFERDGAKVSVAFAHGQEGLNGQSTSCP
jgi:hypothetical protein